jgi:hypothetical protein
MNIKNKFCRRSSWSYFTGHTLIEPITLRVGSGSEGVQNIEEGGDKFGFMSKFRKGLRVAGGKKHKEGKGSIKDLRKV